MLSLLRDPRAYYFGCWQQPGHHLHHVGGVEVHPRDGVPFDPFSNAPWLDGSLAPRRAAGRRFGRERGELFCAIAGRDDAERKQLADHGDECDQGVCALHRLRGHTLMAWWDRTQGDTRRGCNSVFIVEGEHTAAAMLELWPRTFPVQAGNLERAGVHLREVTP